MLRGNWTDFTSVNEIEQYILKTDPEYFIRALTVLALPVNWSIQLGLDLLGKIGLKASQYKAATQIIYRQHYDYWVGLAGVGTDDTDRYYLLNNIRAILLRRALTSDPGFDVNMIFRFLTDYHERLLALYLADPQNIWRGQYSWRIRTEVLRVLNYKLYWDTGKEIEHIHRYIGSVVLVPETRKGDLLGLSGLLIEVLPFKPELATILKQVEQLCSGDE
jgi:hypothetical protein